MGDARSTVELADSGLGARIPGEPFIACLVLAVVDPGANHRPCRHDHEEEADYHITIRNDVMDGEIVTADAQGPVVAWCVIMNMLIITVCNTD